MGIYTVLSHFKFTLPKLLQEVFVTQNDEKLNRKTDDDGDLVVQRKDFSPDLTLSISNKEDFLTFKLPS